MIVRCWNCGNDHEVSEAAIRSHERATVINALVKEANLAGTVGDVYRYTALMRAVDVVEHL